MYCNPTETTHVMMVKYTQIHRMECTNHMMVTQRAKCKPTALIVIKAYLASVMCHTCAHKR